MVAAPVNIRFPLQNITDVSFVVQWDAVSNQSVDRYIVSVYWTDDENLIQTVTVNETSYTVTGLTPDTTYTVTVAAVDELDCTEVPSTGKDVTTDTSNDVTTVDVSHSINPRVSMDIAYITNVSRSPNFNATVTTFTTGNPLTSTTIVMPTMSTTIVHQGMYFDKMIF